MPKGIAKNGINKGQFIKGTKLSLEMRKKISDGHKGSRAYQWRGGKERFRCECGKIISFYSKKCTRCNGLNNSGIKNPAWKGGVKPENLKIRHSLEMELWKKACLVRDNFTCQKTRRKGGRLVVHHINNFSNFVDLRTSLSNGITLSKESHTKFHKKYGYRNNTREQLEEFLVN